MLEIGVAKVDITAYQPKLGMMGWGMINNIVNDTATPLHARAFVVVNPGEDTRLCMVCCELAFITLVLREGVCQRLRDNHPELGLDRDNVMLMGTHTHSGPGGISHYPFYNITIPGFAPDVCDTIIDGIVRAIVQAHATRVPGTVRYAEGQFPEGSDVAFNRAVASYNRNPDVTPVGLDEPKRALDRTLRLLRFDDAEGQPLGALNWFGVHCTSVHSDNTIIHFDNKGYAAQFLEQSVGGTFVAAFAQGAAGDVTPNFRRYREKPWVRGASLDDDESARQNGRLQFAKAQEVFEAAANTEPLSAQLAHAHAYVDFSRIEVDPRFANGRRGLSTAPAEIGMSMFFGTAEGPGLPRRFLFLQKVATRLRPTWRRLVSWRDPERYRQRDETHAEKISWVQTGRRTMFGLRHLRRLPLPWDLHPALALIREMDREGLDANPKPWTPNVLPVQLFQLGSVAIAAVPAEFTTMSGVRLRHLVAEDLRELSVEHAVLAGYANAYSGYVTTPEEYAVQDYEGGSTHFGKWTLPAYMTQFARLCRQLTHPDEKQPEPTLTPPEFSEEELAERTFPARTRGIWSLVRWRRI